MSGFDTIPNELHIRRLEKLFRERVTIESPQGAVVRIDGKQLVNFSSNDYLGLANHKSVVDSFARASRMYGVGSGSSHLICGHNKAHRQFEEAIAEYTNRDRALLFNNGYMANIGVINGLISDKDALFQDRLNHASLMDAGILSRAKMRRYLHSDIDSLKMQLSRSSASKKLIVTDGVFSMDGDLAPIAKLSHLASDTGSLLIVDDSHGVGCLGSSGGGSLEALNINQEQVPLITASLGKAFGTYGAFVAGSNDLIEALIQHSRTYTYTTAIPPAVAAASLTSLELIISGDELRQKLNSLIARFRSGASQIGLELINSSTPIQPIIVGDSGTALAMSSYLKSQGMLVTAIRPPTVPRGQARLRVTINATHTEEHIDQLLDALSQAVKAEPTTSI